MSVTNFKKPSNKVIFVGIVTIAIIISAIIYKFYSRPTQQTEQDTSVTVSVNRNESIPEIDSDGDGVPDWEEILWKLDPYNPDTNNEGVNDKVKIQNRKEEDRLAREKMLRENPQDSFSFYKDQNLTKTEAISRALFEQAVTISTNEIPLTADDASKLAEILSNTLLTKTVSIQKQLTTDDIRTIRSPSIEQVRTYGNLVASTMKIELSEYNSEFLALVEFMQTGNTKTLSKPTPVIQHYTTVADNLSNIAAPIDIAQNHLSLINGLYINAEVLYHLQSLENDPISILPYLQTYQANYGKLISSLHLIKEYIISLGIVYNEFEDGFLLVTMY